MSRRAGCTTAFLPRERAALALLIKRAYTSNTICHTIDRNSVANFCGKLVEHFICHSFAKLWSKNQNNKRICPNYRFCLGWKIIFWDCEFEVIFFILLALGKMVEKTSN